jgi:hypothetical protein
MTELKEGLLGILWGVLIVIVFETIRWWWNEGHGPFH